MLLRINEQDHHRGTYMKPKLLLQSLPLVMLLAHANSHAQVTLQASYTQTAGCSFGAPVPGTMTLSSDWTTMSTESAGASRSSILVSNVGPAVFTIATGGFSWTRNGSSTGAAILTTMFIMDAAANGTALAGNYSMLPTDISYPSSGSRTLYLKVSGTNPSVFYNAGTFKFSVPVSCM